MGFVPNNVFKEIINSPQTLLNNSRSDYPKFNNHTNNLDQFKTRLGAGFRPNLFKVTFQFPAVTKDNDFATRLLDNIVKSPSYDGGTSINTTNITGVLSQAITSKLATKYSSSKQTKEIFALLCTKFQLPGSTLELTDDIIKNRKTVIGNTPGAVTCDVMNDQWNANWTFLKNYTNLITDGKAVYYYPDDYKCTIIVELYSLQFKTYIQYTLINCTMTTVGDLDLDKGEGKPPTLGGINIDYEDYKVTTIPPKFIKFGFMGSVESNELIHIARVNLEYQVNTAILRIQEAINQRSSEEMQNIIDFYNELMNNLKQKHVTEQAPESINILASLVQQAQRIPTIPFISNNAIDKEKQLISESQGRAV